MTSGMPPGIAQIVVNEAAERFSFYGMRAVLVVFMTQHMSNPLSEVAAREWYHAFTFAVSAATLL